MKKLLAFILCLTMAMGAVAFAEEMTGTELNKDVLEGQTTVSLTIDPEANEFVVVIPASVTIDPDTKKGSAEIVLKSGWKLPTANGLQVKLISAKNEAGNEKFSIDSLRLIITTSVHLRLKRFFFQKWGR